MLDIKFIRENPDLIKENCKNRLAKVNIDDLLDLDKKTRELESEIESLRAERNSGSKSKPTPEQIEKIRKVGDTILKLEKELAPIRESLDQMLLQVPNLSHPKVKISQDEDECVVLEQNYKPTEFDFRPLDHVELSEKLDLIDFERGTKVAGSKFYFLKNELVLLEIALMNYALETVMKHGFVPIITPDLASREILAKMGYNPRGESTQVYNIENSDLSLIGTAEITMGGFHKDETLEEKELPKKYVALSHCFRTEAGSYSKFSKGIFRVHQFTKVEMFMYVTPDMAESAHNEMLSIEKEIFAGLKIPFRVIDHTSSDLGAPSYRTFDLEAWMPGKPSKDGSLGDWAEITSTSNCTDYQARALSIKYKTSDGKKAFVNTINGTGIAFTRAMIAILENFQQKDGSIKMPEALCKYLPFKEIAKK